MLQGISEKSKQLRRQLLQFNGPDMAARMVASGFDDPVGLVVDMTDDFGKQLTYAILQSHGMPLHEIPETIAAYMKDATRITSAGSGMSPMPLPVGSSSTTGTTGQFGHDWNP